ncbi:MAG TPA: hypothetical protein PK239_17585 [Chitinophagales bacterium]|nr:hypothetical protein [Chitinophagales bacterium]HRK29090.1 hypothetical protein [Chitinophagales bacterium]
MSANNPFKQLAATDKLPDKHKSGVLNTIDTTRFIIEIIDLFTFKQIQTDSAIIKTLLENTADK